MKSLVTGSTGFLGRHLTQALKKRGDAITALDSKSADLRHDNSLDPFIKTKFDRIYHLAAWTQAGDFCLKYPGDQWLINQAINTNVLRFWREHQPQAKLIALGTSCAYDPMLDHREEFYLQGKPIDSLFTYAMTKRMLLTGLQSLAMQDNLRYLYLIPSTLYGSNYHQDTRQKHFIFDLIRKIVDGKQLGREVTLWGDGSQVRELIHVEDFIATMLALEHIDNEVYNIGAGKGESIRTFAKIISKQTGYPFEAINYDTTRYVGAHKKVLSTEKLQKTLPQFSMRPLEEGIRETIAWHLKT